MSQAFSAPKTTGHLEMVKGLAAGALPAPPIAKLLGFHPIEVELGHVVMEMDAKPEHANPMGTLHGGVICDLADGAIGCALATTLEDDESFTTVDLTANYFKPVWNARLRASAHVTRRTKSLGFIECDVKDEKGSVVAKVFSTCMVLRGEQAQGR